ALGGSGTGTVVIIGDDPVRMAIVASNKRGTLMNRSLAVACGALALIVSSGAATAAPLFVVGGTFAAGAGPTAIVAGDFDEDGHQDFAATDNAGGIVTIRFGLGNGAFAGTGNFGAGNSPTGLASGYVNADAHLDLVSVSAGQQVANVQLG